MVGGGALLHRAATGHCFVYQALGRRSNSERGATPETQRSITIEKPVGELYESWRDPGHLNAIMGEFVEVSGIGEGRLRWRAKLPAGRVLEWTTIRTEDKPNERIAWRSEPGAPFEHQGWVRFSPAPADWGTVVTLSLGFGAAGSPLAALTNKLLPRVPMALEEAVLRRCKNLSVAGEIPTLKRNASARKQPAESSRSRTNTEAARYRA
jgi:uncharacterized membrane protein